MTEEAKTDEPGAGDEQQADEPRADEGAGKARRGRMGDGIRQGIGVLSAFKEALEETIQEARDRGDLSTDRAKEVMREALDRAQSAAEDARGKLDFAHQADLDRARSDLDRLRASFDALRTRVDALEQHVFGEGREE